MAVLLAYIPAIGFIIGLVIMFLFGRNGAFINLALGFLIFYGVANSLIPLSTYYSKELMIYLAYSLIGVGFFGILIFHGHRTSSFILGGLSRASKLTTQLTKKESKLTKKAEKDVKHEEKDIEEEGKMIVQILKSLNNSIRALSKGNKKSAEKNLDKAIKLTNKAIKLVKDYIKSNLKEAKEIKEEEQIEKKEETIETKEEKVLAQFGHVLEKVLKKEEQLDEIEETIEHNVENIINTEIEHAKKILDILLKVLNNLENAKVVLSRNNLLAFRAVVSEAYYGLVSIEEEMKILESLTKKEEKYIKYLAKLIKQELVSEKKLAKLGKNLARKIGISIKKR